MDNKIKLRITRYQRLAMEHAKTIEELGNTREDLRIAIKACAEQHGERIRLLKELEQVKRERYALLEYIENSIRPCSLCKYDTAETNDVCRDCENEGHWEWRGVQEVAEDD